MVGHEIFALLGTIVVGAIILGSFKPGTQTASVLSAAFGGFSGLLSSMEGNTPAGTAQAA